MPKLSNQSLAAIAFLNLRAAGVGTPSATVGAARACAGVWAWAVAHQDLDLEQWPTQVEYARYWKVNERTVRRELDRFSKAFPNEDGPERLARWLLSEVHQRLNREDASPALSVRAPDWALPVAA